MGGHFYSNSHPFLGQLLNFDPKEVITYDKDEATAHFSPRQSRSFSTTMDSVITLPLLLRTTLQLLWVYVNFLQGCGHENMWIGYEVVVRWDLIQPQRDYFWNRWSCEYLHQLQERRKWRTSHPDVNIGDLVLLKEQNKPLQWKLARIVQIFPGEDDHVRVVLLRTPKGLLKRPITKICPLPYKEVTRRISDVTYKVESLDTTNRRRKPKEIVHVVRMKNYRDPDEQLDLPEDEPAV
ncbi:hypothetical protein LAZ67_2003219 [Cordylochernes scorpioides]|uniref:DUF5641 domain-containing protein n=1 Tax=Cordylochernes scorpioides TaxID=51811 RepID=A0ABY6K2U4_9ARAC|nr:hypothetical protein LAZ67_2003219 [Cordylochernes scorpioides]